MSTAILTPEANPRLTREKAAEYLGGISPETLATWASRGGGPRFIKIGSRVFYLQSDLDAFIEARRVSFSAQLPPELLDGTSPPIC